jgi:chlorite dismutase
MADRTFAKFTFFKIDPEWRRRDDGLRAADKHEFLAACEDFALDRSLRAYSTIGTRGDVDLVLLSQSPNLDDLHTFHVVLGQSGLAKWMDTPHSFLSMTKRSPYSEEQARPEICVSERKYLFLYPMVKQRRWYGLPPEERQRIMKSHIEVGRRYPEITINTSYSFGLDDQEFVVAFEGDDPGMFLDLVQELRPTESSAYTERETPIFTCVAMSRRNRRRRRRRARRRLSLEPYPDVTDNRPW